jgi:hypothetical protein
LLVRERYPWSATARRRFLSFGFFAFLFFVMECGDSSPLLIRSAPEKAKAAMNRRTPN